MFERFTTAARQIVVLSQEEARLLDHNYIGTEHLLLGLLHEADGIAGRALAETPVTLSTARAAVLAAVGRGKKPLKGHIPFTPRAKKVLEKALREALALRTKHVGTEHLLLGLLEINEGLAVTLLRDAAVDVDALRLRVISLATAAKADRAAGVPAATGGPRQVGVSANLDSAKLDSAKLDSATPGAPEGAAPRRTAAANAGILTAAHYAGHDPVGSHHLLLALLTDESSAATRTLAGLGVDVPAVRDALLDADLTDTSDELPEVTGRHAMSLRLTDSSLIVEATDHRLLGLARLARNALRARRTPPDQDSVSPAEESPDDEALISGRDDVADSLSAVWTVLAASLEDIRSRAAEDEEG
ncbi:Clp protease N-terminal domain-containing protein [Frankia sp. AgKG'84/4]|uniref:Clp protease N-terminal domain-containing protein n=1 Tax=Frankia sp. AgKG'84/4 TaxID=573490 RepID=UPI00200D46A0|nr:Clp protease N-terminal domain-containing protein [Frankia sp. AgKG'84/4]MCL9796137.1 Clp protease [Frankia sp. AgKG'84/4]